MKLLPTMIILCAVGLAIIGVASSSFHQAHAESAVVESTQISLPFTVPVIEKWSKVDQAYAAIRKRRTRYDPTNATILPTHREYLTELTALLDQCILWRVSGMQAVAAKDPDLHRWVAGGQQLLDGVRGLRVPAGAESHHALIREAISELSAFFDAYATAPNLTSRKRLEANNHLRRASTAMRTAYAELLKLHRYADAYAQAAFYDSHMALDPL